MPGLERFKRGERCGIRQNIRERREELRLGMTTIPCTLNIRL